MPRLAILIGVVLILVGVAGYSLGGERKSLTAFIPSVEGVLLVICGAVVLANPGARKHAMHAAATIGLLGFLAATGRLLPALIKGNVPPALTVTSLALMIGLSALFVICCVASFVSARKNRPEDVAGFTPSSQD